VKLSFRYRGGIKKYSNGSVSSNGGRKTGNIGGWLPDISTITGKQIVFDSGREGVTGACVRRRPIDRSVETRTALSQQDEFTEPPE